MPGVIAMAGGYWTYGGSILTFAFPMLLFIAVAGALYVLYTKPHLVPGHRYHMQTGPAAGRPTASLPGDEVPGAADQHTGPAAAAGEQMGPASGPLDTTK